MEMRKCWKCKAEKDVSEFGSIAGTKRLKSICRNCDAEIHRFKYQSSSEERSAALARSWQAKQRRFELGICWQCDQPIENGTRRCAKHSLDARRRSAAARNKARKGTMCRACGIRPKLADRVRCAECADVENKRHRTLTKVLIIEAWDACFKHYGETCACCGESVKRLLTMDHMHNNGSEHRKVIGKSRLCLWLIRNGFPEGFQTLCFSCNMGKYLNGGICPHKEKLGGM